LATGNPTVELHINDLVHSIEVQDVAHPSPKALFTWLEPLGIGGHALLTGYGERGCFRCLYTPTPEAKQLGADEFIHNRASFAAKDQRFARTLTGCDSLYTPFSSTHVLQTIAMAVNLALRTLQGAATLNPLLSWKGDASAFLKENYDLSSRYAASVETLYNGRYSYSTPLCTACGSPQTIAGNSEHVDA
jgi:hypothetical protein